jgi:hypothetical protein
MNPLETLRAEVEKLGLPTRIVMEPQLSPNQMALVDHTSNEKLLITHDSGGFSWWEASAGLQTRIAPGPMKSRLAKGEIISKIQNWVSKRDNVAA